MTDFKSCADQAAENPNIADPRLGYVQAVGEVIGGLANIIQVAGWAFPVASTLSGLVSTLLGKTDDSMAPIQSALNALLHEVHSSVEHLDIENIQARLHDVNETLEIVYTHGITFTPDTPFHLLHDSTTLLQDLGTREYWLRPFIDEVVWHNNWTNATPPRDSDDKVLDPRVTQPGYLAAVGYWLSALALVFPAQRPAELDLHLPAFSELLRGYHDEMAAGLREVPPPTPIDVLLDLPGSKWDFLGRWTLSGNYVGAVDVYTGTALVQSVWPWLGTDVTWQQEDYDRLVETFPLFLASFALGCAVRRKALYVKLGLGDMWDTLQGLHAIGNLPVAVVNPHSSWSIRELSRLLGQTMHTTDPAVVSGLDVLHAMDRVSHRAPLIPGLQETRSVRQALNAATL